MTTPLERLAALPAKTAEELETERVAALEEEARKQDLTAWTAAGGTEAAHKKAWPDRWLKIVGERADESRRRARQDTTRHYKANY